MTMNYYDKQFIINKDEKCHKTLLIFQQKWISKNLTYKF